MQRVNYTFETVCKIGLVSDTHIPARARFLPPVIFNVLNGVDLILHAGDLVEERVLAELRVLAPVEAVGGNMDPLELREKLGLDKIITIGEITLALTHGTGAHWSVVDRVFRRFSNMGVQGIVFGHSHEPFLERRDGILLINPGSTNDPRWGSSASCACLHLDGKQLDAEIINL